MVLLNFVLSLFPKQSIVGVLNSFKDCQHSEDYCQVPGFLVSLCLPLPPFASLCLPLSLFVSLHVGGFAGLPSSSPPFVSLRLPLSPIVSRRLHCFLDVPLIVWGLRWCNLHEPQGNVCDVWGILQVMVPFVVTLEN